MEVMEKRLEFLKKKLGLNNKELAGVLDVTPSAVTEVLKGRTKHIPSRWIIILIEKYQINGHWLLTGQGKLFGCSGKFTGLRPDIFQRLHNLPEDEQQNVEDFIRFLEFKNLTKGIKEKTFLTEPRDDSIIEVPVLGRIAAGFPILAEENVEGTIRLHENIFSESKEIFALKVRGESMIEAGILDNDTAIIKKIVDLSLIRNSDIIAILVDNEATLKYFFQKNGKIILQPANPAYEPFELKEKDNPAIIGKMIGLIRAM